MKRVASALLPLITIDRQSAEPLHRQIYEAFRSAIVQRKLRPKARVPSTRMLASELSISRMPVLNAYAQLLAEGYFESPDRFGDTGLRFTTRSNYGPQDERRVIVPAFERDTADFNPLNAPPPPAPSAMAGFWRIRGGPGGIRSFPYANLVEPGDASLPKYECRVGALRRSYGFELFPRDNRRLS